MTLPWFVLWIFADIGPRCNSQVSTPAIVSKLYFWNADFLQPSRLFESVYCLGFRLIFNDCGYQHLGSESVSEVSSGSRAERLSEAEAQGGRICERGRLDHRDYVRAPFLGSRLLRT